MEDNKLDMAPLYAEALSFTNRIYDDIDKIYYGENKYEYSRLAKESRYYDCMLCKNKSLLREAYFKKLIGIIEYAGKYEYADDIVYLFKKGYHNCYKYFKNLEKIDDFGEYTVYLKQNLVKDYTSDEELNCMIVAGLFFTGMISENISECHNTEDFITYLQMYSDFNFSGYGRIEIKKIAADELKKIRKENPLKSDLENYIHKSVSEDENPYAFLYDVEGISSLSIFEDVEIKKKDLDELIYIYSRAKSFKSRITLDDFCIPAVQIKCILKAYNQAKRIYFENNRESTYLEMQKKQEEIEESGKQLEKERNAMRKLEESAAHREKLLKEEINALKKENTTMKRHLEQMESDAREVIALREYAYSRKNGKEEDYKETEDREIDSSILNEISGVVIGGHPNWQLRLKEMLPKWKFISPDVTLAEEIVRNASLVILNVSYIGHPMYNKAISIIRTHGIKMGYVDNVNIKLCLEEIRDIYEG